MTTNATAIKITRRDAVVEGYTDHDRDRTVSGQLYKSTAGYVPSAVKRVSDMSVDNLQITGFVTLDDLSEEDLLAGVYDGARVELLLIDWEAQTLVTELSVCEMGPVSIADEQFTANLYSIEGELQKPIGRTAGLRCDAALGDSRCKFVLTADSDTVDAVTSERRIFTLATGQSQAAGYYDGGKVVWTSGENDGRTMDIKRYTLAPETIELYEPMPSAIAPTDGLDLFRGCDKRFETCRDTFINWVNFRGFPYTPGVSDLVGGQTETN